MATKDKRTISSDEFTPEEARYVLEGLVKDRRVSKGELKQYLSRMKDEAEELVERLRSLGWQGAVAAGAVVGGAALASSSRGRAAVKRAAKAVKKAVTPEQEAGRKLQGRYLGLIRQIPASQRVKFSTMAKTDGRQAAIDAMRAHLGKDEEGPSRKGAKKRGRKKARRKTAS